MLRRRLITVLTLNDGVLFRTKHFRPDYRYTQNFVDAFLADEIVVLDVTRPGHGKREAFYDAVSELASRCFVPLACGGGIRSIEEVRRMLELGADKVVLNTGALDRPELVTEASALYGAQSVVVSIDAERHEDGGYEVYAEFGSRPTGLDPVQWARRAQHLGAGEIFLTSIEKDGSLEGYDNILNRMVSDAVSVPVVVSGGGGNWQHFCDAIVEGGASGVCTTNVYHFTDASIRSAKQYMARAGIAVRI